MAGEGATWPGPAPVVVESDGLRLREWSAADVPLLPGLFDDPAVGRWTPLPSPFGPDEAVAYVARAAERRSAGTVQLAVTAGDRVLGEVLVIATDEPAAVELGYVIGPSWRGRGLAARALRAVLPVLASAGVTGARLTIAEDNAASIAVARQCGFSATGAAPTPWERGDLVLLLEVWQLVLSD